MNMDTIIAICIIVAVVVVGYFVVTKTKYKPLGDKLASLFRKKPDGDQ